jgi:glutathione peroxidase
MQTEMGPKGLQILCFPCNQFGSQEPKGNDEIKAFAADKGFTGMMMDKIDVNGPNTDSVWAHLKEKFPGDVRWNFAAKFIIDKNGNVVERNGDAAAASKDAIMKLL